MKLPFLSLYLGIQCVVKLLYAHRKGSFTGLAHLGSKWTVCGTPFETNSTSLQLSTTKMCNNLFIVCFHLQFFNLSFFSPSPGSLTSSRRVVISIYPLTYMHTRRGSHHCWLAQASKQQHISGLPLSFVTLLGARTAQHCIRFI